MLSVLCRESNREVMEDIIFTHTTSIGIRRFPAERTALDRRKIQVETAYGTADVKVCSYKGKNYCYPEYDSVSALCDKQEKCRGPYDWCAFGKAFTWLYWVFSASFFVGVLLEFSLIAWS